MPTNSYFTHGTSGEQNLVEELVIEQIKMFGQDVYYIPRVIVDEDPAFGEDSLSKFDDAYLIEAYLENVEGFGGDARAAHTHRPKGTTVRVPLSHRGPFGPFLRFAGGRASLRRAPPSPSRRGC